MSNYILSGLVVLSLIVIGIGFSVARNRFKLYFDIESPTQLSIKFKKDGVTGTIHINKISDCYTASVKPTPTGVRVELPLDYTFEQFQGVVNQEVNLYSIGVQQNKALELLKSIFDYLEPLNFGDAKFDKSFDKLLTNYFKSLPDIHFQTLSYVR